MGYYVPNTLKRAKAWILWKLEDGKKKPYSANYNGLASTTKAHTWAYYSKAAQKLEYTGEEYNGLGFVFTPGSGLVFIDLDHCIDEWGELSPFAEEVLALFPETYTEYSQSETGLHIVCRGSVPRAYKSDLIEIYSSGRYMAFTGNAHTQAEPAEAQAALDQLIKRYNLQAEPERAPALLSTPITADDKEIIARAERGGNGAAFAELWAGNWSAYKSQSEADLRLISILLYYSGNLEQVERLFLASGLGERQKAQQGEYLRRTIQKAAENMKPSTGQSRSPRTQALTSKTVRSRENLTDTPEKRKLRRF